MASFSDEMADTIALIYDAALDDRHWPEAVGHVADLLGASTAGVGLQDTAIGFPLTHAAPRAREATEAYAMYFHQFDPILAALRVAPPGIYTNTMFLSREAQQRTRFYQEFCVPYDLGTCIQAFTFRDSVRSGLVVFGRPHSADDYGPNDMQLLAALLPHLERGMRVRLSLDKALGKRDGIVAALDSLAHAILLVRRDATIVMANRSAEAMLLAKDGIKSDHGKLGAAMIGQNSALHRLIGKAALDRTGTSGAALRLNRPEPRQPLSVIVVPLRGADEPLLPRPARAEAMVLITDAEHHNVAARSLLRTFYDLTRAEAEVACLIAKGGGVNVVSRHLKIAPSTTKTHMKQIFRKTQVASQAELTVIVGRLSLLS